MANDVERRKYSRIAVNWPINIITGHGIIEGEVKNISHEGLYICCNKPLNLNEKMRISILPPDHEPLSVRGSVIWSDLCGMDDNYSQVCFGVCLVEISDKDRDFLCNFE